MHEAENIIAQLGLQPLPGEGGFYQRTWTGSIQDGRPSGTAIYFLITREAFSALHRLAHDEIWHFYAGDPVQLVVLAATDSSPEVVTLGADILAGQTPQRVVSAGIWQGARLADGGSRGWALLGCTMTPGWDDRDWELGVRSDLRREFPAAADWIDRLTR
jgi:uncharacterized protein